MMVIISYADDECNSDYDDDDNDDNVGSNCTLTSLLNHMHGTCTFGYKICVY